MDRPLSNSPTVRTALGACLGLLLATAGLTVFVACNDSGANQPSPQAIKPTTVRDTFDQLRQWHRAGLYTAMRPYIDAAGCEGTIDLLVAVDHLMAANTDFLAAVRRACPDLDMRPYDLSFARDNLDLFSRSVEWVSIQENENEAIVTANVSGRLPLSEIRFRRLNDRWVYVPGKDNPAVINVIRQMSRSLNQIELVATSRKPSNGDIHEEYRVRILSKMQGLGRPQMASSGI